MSFEQLLEKLNKIFDRFLSGDKISLKQPGVFTNNDSDINVLITDKFFSIHQDGNDLYNTDIDLDEEDLKVILEAIKYLKEWKIKWT